MEQEHEEELLEGWLEHGGTKRLLKAHRLKLASCYGAFESAAARSSDADVRDAYTRVMAERVFIAELQGKDEVEARYVG